jgi:hypothetical protein
MCSGILPAPDLQAASMPPAPPAKGCAAGSPRSTGGPPRVLPRGPAAATPPRGVPRAQARSTSP